MMRDICSWSDAWQMSSKMLDALRPNLLSKLPGPLATKIFPPVLQIKTHVPYQSTLSPTPRTIHLLWMEYVTGIGR